MARKGGLTAIAIKNLGAKDARYEVPDPACPGLHLVVQPSGAKSWAFRYRFGGKTRKLTIGGAITDKGIEVISIGEARDVADEARVSAARKIDPIEAGRAKQRRAAEEAEAAVNTLRVVAEKYLDLPEQKRLRSLNRRENDFKRLIYPTLGDRRIESIKRSEIADLLDDIAKTKGPVMADRILAALRRLLNWYALRSISDDYVSPIMRGMARTSTKERARKRILSDNELRALWRACDEAGMFGHYVKFTLLTATRRNEAAHLRRAEIDGTNWTIPGSRYKTGIDHVIPLSNTVVEVISKVPKMKGCDFVFTPDGVLPIAGFGSRKEDFDKLMLEQLRKISGGDTSLQRWTLHDLRRTARTMMSQAGVSSEHAELCLGHVKRGVEGTYDRYQYRAEKGQAFAKLAELVEQVAGEGP
jgi:integrase